MAVAEHSIMPADRLCAGGVTSTRSVQLYFAVLSLLGLGAFVLGVENRFTAEGPFVLPPRVDWIPPLSAATWSDSFAIHQEDPVFAACGGTETLALFKTLYWWEWLRRAFVLLLAVGASAGLSAACVARRFRFALPRLGTLALLSIAYLPARDGVTLIVGASGTASFNVGQYRHAVDVAFASIALAGVVASAVAPPLPEAPSRRRDRAEWLWIAAIVIDICFGALFAARNAAPAWSTSLGYEGHFLPPLAQLFSYSPGWLNFTFNTLTIQLVHRGLSAALWIAAAWQLGSALQCATARRAIVRFALITAQMVLGTATLALGVPAAASIAHQIGGVVLLAAAFAFLASGWAATSAPARAHRSDGWRIV